MESGRTREQRQFRIAFGAVAAVLFVLWLVSGRSGPSGTTEPKSKGPTESECKADIRCWRKQHATAITVECTRAIERRARYDVQWDSQLTSPMFKRFGWLDEAAGTIILFGDSVRFQNGFGAFSRMSYACAFDPGNRKVLDVRIEEGSLSD